jgi:hypothetical protein
MPQPQRTIGGACRNSSCHCLAQSGRRDWGVIRSNGKVVYRQLQAAVAKSGVPRAIVSDNGSDLHRGLALFS